MIVTSSLCSVGEELGNLGVKLTQGRRKGEGEEGKLVLRIYFISLYPNLIVISEKLISSSLFCP